MKKLLPFLLVLVLGIFLAACGSEDAKDETNAAEPESEKAETITVTHVLGETEVPKNPEKVVVFDFGILDSMDKLGVEVAAVPQTNIPSYLEKFEGEEYVNAGSLKEPDFEAIHAMSPDLIIISGRQAEMYPELEEIAPTISMALDTTDYMNSFEGNMQLLGEIFGKEDEVAEELVAINETIDGIKEISAASDERGLILLANEGKVSAYGPSSRFGIIHDVFGVEAADPGIESSTHGQSITFEYVLEQNPDMLFVIDRTAAVGGEVGAQETVENELVQKTNAYKNGKIFYLDPDFWYLSGGGLQSVNQMVEDISAAYE
ncbi:siderophore ABC transporter substrate-binding protein [Planomicrobium sp. YIM 101495]|uniref:siderophore ABC transporter substrate-binding protein n=1 Tax=Planomicrobium sp. YIM 101495 TaxID=2665160 RepID=UPI0012B6D9D5|nr:siderophore ABC transporter substrate-binding protein [Planomicrobium sp. YIM 101495]MTD31522.1 ABC transporter substrate-binding protein [Planomicrobium sp. YIM 101495]